jgi:hypothetical protein
MLLLKIYHVAAAPVPAGAVSLSAQRSAYKKKQEAEASCSRYFCGMPVLLIYR